MPLNIKRARRVVQFYPDSAVAAEIEAAFDAVVEAKKAAGDRLASRAVRDAEKALEDAKTRGAATVLDIELEALPRKRFVEVEENHPPRDGSKADENFTINWDTFLAEALPESVQSVKERSTGEVVEVTAKEWAAALEEIADGQYTTLALAVLQLNRNSNRPF